MKSVPSLTESVKRGWFERLALWKKLALGAAALVVLWTFLAALATPFTAQEKARLAGPMMMDKGYAGEGYLSATQTAGKAEYEYAGTPPTRPAAQGPSYIPESAASEEMPVQQVAATATLETWGRQLILTANITLEAPDVRRAYDQIQFIAAAEGALITAANLEASPAVDRKGGGYGHATLVLRVPQSRFHAVRRRLIEAVGPLGGKVRQDQVSSQDVTEEFVDLRARQRHFRSQEAQLLEIMRQARRIPDIISVRDKLSAVQEEIERITARLRFLESRIDLSTISVEIFQKGKKPPTPKPVIANWKKIGKDIGTAWVKALGDVVRAAGWLAVVLTYLLPFAVVGFVIWTAVRLSLRKSRAAGRSAG